MLNILFFKNYKNNTEAPAMAQSLECLPDNHKAPISIPRTYGNAGWLWLSARNPEITSLGRRK